MPKARLYVICPQCHGDGTFAPSGGPQGSGELPCNWPGCNETGFIEFGLFAGLDCYYTYEISEATDPTEWNALSAGNKTAYATILSMGVVDLSDGTAVKSTLWALFGSGTTTRANLEALIA